MNSKTILTAAAILLSFTLFGQLYEIGLDQKTKNASLIIEGEVVEQHSYIGVDNMIYTANKIKVYKIFKGSTVPENITIITLPCLPKKIKTKNQTG